MSESITIIIPTKNESKNILRCIDSIGKDFAQEILVIDSSSTDDTVMLAKGRDVKVVNFEWNGRFPKKRNWTLRNHPPKTEWVLFLDADEFLTDSVKREISKTIKNTPHVGFWLSYSIYFEDKELRGGYPLTKLALFRPRAGEYEHIEDLSMATLDMEVHEHPILTGSTGRIGAKIQHNDFRGLHHYIQKHNDYSSWEAHRLWRAKRDKTQKQWTIKQHIKQAILPSPTGAIIYFIGSYILKLGFLDGMTGLRFTMLKCSYFYSVYCKYVEISRAQSKPNSHQAA